MKFHDSNDKAVWKELCLPSHCFNPKPYSNLLKIILSFLFYSSNISFFNVTHRYTHIFFLSPFYIKYSMLVTLFTLYFYLTTRFLEISPHEHTEIRLVFTLLCLFLWLQNTPWCTCIRLHTINPLVVCIFKCSLWLLCGEVAGYWRPESVGWRPLWWSRQEVMDEEEVSAVWKKWAQLAHVLELEAAAPHDGQNVMCDAKRGNGDNCHISGLSQNHVQTVEPSWTSVPLADKETNSTVSIFYDFR